MFSIEKIPFGPLTVYRLQNNVSGEYADIIPGYGATLNALALRNSEGKLLQLVDGSPDYDYLLGPGTTAYKGCVLFPFPNRIADGTYVYAGHQYQFPINHPSENNALHGTHCNAAFTVHESHTFNDEVQLLLTFEGDGSEGWPYSYLFEVLYILNKSGLVSTLRVTNKSAASMPVGLGVHPYFTLGPSIDTLDYSMSPGHILDVDTRLIPTGTETLAPVYNKTPLSALQFDSCFRTISGNERSWVNLHSANLESTLHVWMETNGEHFLQVYTPPGRKAIAIEPMTCAPDAFNNQIGLSELRRGELLTLTYGVGLR
jgi:aldose 1-epimerase